MENEDEKKNLVLNYLELIDVSSEDDFLIAYPFYDSLEDLRLSVKLENINEPFGSANSSEIDNAREVLHQRKKLSHSESTTRGRPSFLRKSLAWDSAFFTSAGVLDPEELSIVNKGFNTAEAYLLPGIQEDIRMRRSDDSESLYDSDGFYIKSLDGDPFEDVRASINKTNKMSSMNCESGFGQAGVYKFRSSKKVDVANRNRVKSTPITSKRQSIKPQGSERLKKEPHTLISGESNIQSLKPHKLSGGVNPISARQSQRASLGSYNVKSGSKTKKTGSVQDLRMSKSATPPPKSRSKLSLTASKSSTVSLSSSDTSPSSSSSKYSFNSTRRKLDSRKNNLASPGFSIHLSLISKSSSQTSPCCSIDGLSLESYSSTPLTNQNYNYQEPSLDSRVQSSTSQEIQETRSTRNLKPSGLRMPSPKIGFFDEKSMLPEVRGNVKFHFGVHKALANSDVASNTKRLVKLEKPSPQSGIIKHGSVQYASRIRAKNATHVQWLDNDSPQVFAVAKTTRKCPVADSKSKSQTDLSPAMDRESCSKIRKVSSGERDRRKVGTPSSLKAEEKRSKEILKKNMTIKSKGQNDDTGIDRNLNLHKENNEKENLSNVEDEVNGLSRYFEAINVSRDEAKELRVSKSCGEICGSVTADSLNELSKPSTSPFSVPTSIGFTVGTRTPLAEKTSVWNRSVPCGFSAESRENLA